MKQYDRHLFSPLSLALTALFTALFVAGAFIKIPLPFSPVPLTLQTFFCMAAAVLLGWQNGLLAFSCYVFLGLAGLPVFSGGGGIGYALMPSFGFLIGMAISIPVMCFVAHHMGTTFKGVLLAGIIGAVITYIIGGPYMFLVLKLYMHSENARASWVLVNGCLIYMPLDALKIFAAAAVCPRLSKIITKHFT